MNTLAPIAVSPADACEIARVGPTKLYGALNDGSLPAFKLGRRTLIRVADLMAWLAALPRFEPGAKPALRAAHKARRAKSAARREQRAAESASKAADQIEDPGAV